jgi:hypothetical protein
VSAREDQLCGLICRVGIARSGNAGSWPLRQANRSNFVIYLGGVNKGRILSFEERADNWRFQFASGEDVTTRDLLTLDKALLASFSSRTA